MALPQAIQFNVVLLLGSIQFGWGKANNYVQNSFDIDCICSITVENVVYTNDGGSDTITVSLDGIILGTFRTLSRSNYGRLWNVPRRSGRIGRSVVLGPGTHRVRIVATRTDHYLVEIDRVVLTLNCGGSSSCPNPTSMTTPTSPHHKIGVTVLKCILVRHNKTKFYPIIN